jgi:hypothetical protein
MIINSQGTSDSLCLDAAVIGTAQDLEEALGSPVLVP